MASQDVPAVADVAAFKAASAESPQTTHVIFFWADFQDNCKPGSQLHKLFDGLATKYSGQCIFHKVNAEEAVDATDAFGVDNVPFFVVYKNATVVQSVEGANGSELVKAIEIGKAKVVSDEEKSAALTQRLKQLSTAAPIMLFMKGTPSNPRCKFSRATVELLANYAAQYSSFDILSDPDVRAGLKVFSGWPTFPQLYVAGKFVGGLDIMKELDEEGELAEALEIAEVPAPSAGAANAGASGTGASAPAGPIEDRLKALIASSRVMLFMKGSPQSPQCGFSASAVKLLAQAGCKAYGHFDIFTDEAVRAGLKKFSNWPTYPQLYVDGELVGGLDIMKELNEEGELAELVAEQ